MGYFTGFTGGVTLTLGIAYLTLLNHQKNRHNQALAIRSQSYYLKNLVDKQPAPPPRLRAELAREERSTIIEVAKDRWNYEIENAVRWLQNKDWNEVRVKMEGAVSDFLGRGLGKSREELEEAESRTAPKIGNAVDMGKDAARRSIEKVIATVDRAEKETRAVSDKALDASGR